MTQITLRDNGPLLVDGDDLTVVDADGKTFALSGRPVALWRCGASANKPFCDGSHGRVQFQAADRATT